MNPNHIGAICSNFNLGDPISPPIRVHGGLLHVMWRLDTNKSSYAVKQLSHNIDLANELVVKNYNLTEKIAVSFFKNGIPAIGAIKQKKSENYLSIIDETGYLVYPWTQAKSFDKDEILENHVIKISAILAQIHKINLQMPEIQESIFDIHTDDSILAIINKSEISRCTFANTLKQNENVLLKANRAYQHAIYILKRHVVVSHGDLDQKNVLWDENGNPFLIDWESARKLNPTYEILNASLDWSGITTHFEKSRFEKMIYSYRKAGGILNKDEFEASFYGVLGNWLNWLVFNIKRSCDSEESEHKNLGVDQVEKTLTTILNLQKLIPELLADLLDSIKNEPDVRNIDV